jgi:hypothetical protein
MSLCVAPTRCGGHPCLSTEQAGGIVSHPAPGAGAEMLMLILASAWAQLDPLPTFDPGWKLAGAGPAKSVGPVTGAGSVLAGWATEGSKITPQAKDGAFRINGNSRAYLVDDWTKGGRWGDFKYVRLDLHKQPLSFTLDLSEVACGCLACVYLVAMADSDGESSNYCDMAENKKPGYEGGMCYELDLLEVREKSHSPSSGRP